MREVRIAPRRRSSLFFALLMLAVVGLVACGGQARADYHNISSQQLRSMLERKDFFLVDVHVPEQQHIHGTDAVIPYDQVRQLVGKLPADKTARIVLYCRSGNMSATAARDLVSLGYSNVWNLEKGTQEWRSLGYPVDQ